MSSAFRFRDGAVPAVSVRFERRERIDESPDLSYLEQSYSDVEPAERERYIAQDHERMAAYNRGEWYMRGLYVTAYVAVPANGATVVYTLESPGVYGVESDCGAEHESEVWRDEESDLREHMRAMATAFATLEGPQS